MLKQWWHTILSVWQTLSWMVTLCEKSRVATGLEKIRSFFDLWINRDKARQWLP
jgi:hypothetical protein